MTSHHQGRPAASEVVPTLLALLLTSCVLTGCNGGKELATQNGVLITPPETISTFRLAGSLGMAVTDQSAKMVSMRDEHNTVVIFADPGGQAYVNGKAVAQPAGGVVRADGVLFVPVSFEPAIRAALRRAPPPAETASPLPSPAPAAPPRPAALGLVVIDPGHGGQDPGATSIYGDQEKHIVLDVALAAAERLAQSGVNVRMTREDDRFVELEARADMANRCRADLFVSIHADSARNRGAEGFTVYVPRLATRSSTLAADSIAYRLKVAGVASRGRKEANYRVLVRTVCPAVLVELGYLSNGREAARLASASYRQLVAEAIANGIVDYLQGS